MFATVPIRCSRSGKRFALILTKFPRDSAFKLERVVTAQELPSVSGTPARMSNAEFPWKDFACPGCAYRSENGFSTVLCSFCGETLCAGNFSGGEFHCLCGKRYSVQPIDYIERSVDS